MLTPLKALRFKDSLGPGSSCQEVWMGWHLCRQTCWSILPQYRAYVIYVCSVLALFLSYAAFNYCAHFLRNWGCWTGEWKEHNMWYIYIYICMYVCSVLALFLSCANMYVCSFLKLFICCATFNYCALLLIRNWWCWTGEWKEHMWYIYIYIYMYVCSILALFLSCATFNYCALLLRNWWWWKGEWKEYMWNIYMYVCSVLALFPSCATFN